MSESPQPAAPVADEEPPEDGGPGARLRRAREELGLTVADAAAQMKLSVRQVESLEANRFAELPGTVFVRGFARNYARMVKLDPAALIASIEPMLGTARVADPGPGAAEIPFPTRKGVDWRWYVIGALLLILPLLVYEAYFNRPSGPAQKPAVAPAPTTEPIQPQREPVPQSSGPPQSEAAIAGAVGGVASDGAANVAAAAVPGDQQPGVGKHRARVVTQQDSWIEVRDVAGLVLHSSLVTAGSERVLDLPAKPLAFTIGNAAAVSMTLDGKAVDLKPHTRVSVARFTLED